MALTDENSGGLSVSMPVQPMNYGGGYGGYPMAYPVAPVYGYGGGYNNGFGGGFGDSWIILFLFAMMFGGGWGGMGGFGGWGGGFGNMFEFPWLLNGQNGINNNVNDGFRSAQISDNITSVRDGVSNLATQLCGCCGDIQMGIAGINQNIGNSTAAIQNSLCQGFAGTTAAVTGAQNAITQQMYNNEISSLNRSFAEQTANMQGFNGVNSGVSDLRYTVATEACAGRAAVGDALQNVTMQNTGNTNAIVSAITAGIQSIKDDLCQDRLDAERRENANLRSELMYARGQASQTEQTAAILANNNAQTALFQQGLNNEVDALYNRLNNCPVPTTPVYGRTPIFTCQQNQCPGAAAF